MYSVTVESRFSAMHHIRLHNGTAEPPHGHDWIVRVTFSKSSLDELGMVVDFADAKRALKNVLARLHYVDLNQLTELMGKNPTTEVVAEWLFQQIAAEGFDSLARVEVTEAPGCLAVYEPD